MAAADQPCNGDGLPGGADHAAAGEELKRQGGGVVAGWFTPVQVTAWADGQEVQISLGVPALVASTTDGAWGGKVHADMSLSRDGARKLAHRILAALHEVEHEGPHTAP